MMEITSAFPVEGFQGALPFFAPWILGIELLSSLWHNRPLACCLELAVLGVKKCLVTEYRTVSVVMKKNCQGGDFRKSR